MKFEEAWYLVTTLGYGKHIILKNPMYAICYVKGEWKETLLDYEWFKWSRHP